MFIFFETVMESIGRFFTTVWNEMLRGNFSFLILVVGIAQFIVMVEKKRRNKK